MTNGSVVRARSQARSAQVIVGSNCSLEDGRRDVVLQVHRAHTVGHGERVADVTQPSRHLRCVHRQHQGGEPGLFGAADQAQQGVTLAEPVDLEPQRSTRDLRDVGEGLAGEDAHHERAADLARGGGAGQLAVGMRQPVVCHRGDTDRDLQRRAQ
jgi:hypothetical protein